MGNTLKNFLLRYLRELRNVSPDDLLDARYQKFRRMGVFVEGLTAGEESPSANGER
jgi:acetyl-CoA carboxylase alpha subunit